MKLNVSILKLIAKLFTYDGNTQSLSTLPITRVVAALRLFGVFLCILLCALSRNAYFTYIIIAILLLHLSLMPVKDIKVVVKTVLAADVFSALILLPSLFMGHPGTFLTVLMKVTESVMLLSILNTEVDWKNMTAAFRAFKVPSIFIFTLDLTVKYLVILGRFSDKLLEAVSLRSVGKKHWRTSGVGDILGTTFLKSQRIAQHTSEAMECRCFNGTYDVYDKHKWNKWDVLYIVVLIGMLGLFVATQSK